MLGPTRKPVFLPTKGLTQSQGGKWNRLRASEVPGPVLSTLGNHVGEAPPSWGCGSEGKRGGACEESAESETSFCKNACDVVSMTVCVDGAGVGEPGAWARSVPVLRVSEDWRCSRRGRGSAVRGGLRSTPRPGERE